MFLKEKRKEKKLKDPKKKRSAIVNVTLSENKNGIEAERPFCKICDRLHDNVCYIERSDLTSN